MQNIHCLQYRINCSIHAEDQLLAVQDALLTVGDAALDAEDALLTVADVMLGTEHVLPAVRYVSDNGYSSVWWRGCISKSA